MQAKQKFVSYSLGGEFQLLSVRTRQAKAEKLDRQRKLYGVTYIK